MSKHRSRRKRRRNPRSKIPTWGWVAGLAAVGYLLYSKSASANANMGGPDFGITSSNGWG